MTPAHPHLRFLVVDQRATTVVEFAILVPVFIVMTVGLINLALMMFTISSLHYATEQAARCASVQTTVCTSASTTTANATSHYYGPNVSPVFTYADAACGHQVTGTVTYTLSTGVKDFTVPLSASACFP